MNAIELATIVALGLLGATLAYLGFTYGGRLARWRPLRRRAAAPGPDPVAEAPPEPRMSDLAARLDRLADSLAVVAKAQASLMEKSGAMGERLDKSLSARLDELETRNAKLAEALEKAPTGITAAIAEQVSGIVARAVPDYARATAEAIPRPRDQAAPVIARIESVATGLIKMQSALDTRFDSLSSQVTGSARQHAELAARLEAAALRDDSSLAERLAAVESALCAVRVAGTEAETTLGNRLSALDDALRCAAEERAQIAARLSGAATTDNRAGLSALGTALGTALAATREDLCERIVGLEAAIRQASDGTGTPLALGALSPLGGLAGLHPLPEEEDRPDHWQFRPAVPLRHDGLDAADGNGAGAPPAPETGGEARPAARPAPMLRVAGAQGPAGFAQPATDPGHDAPARSMYAPADDLRARGADDVSAPRPGDHGDMPAGPAAAPHGQEDGAVDGGDEAPPNASAGSGEKTGAASGARPRRDLPGTAAAGGEESSQEPDRQPAPPAPHDATEPDDASGAPAVTEHYLGAAE